MLSSLDGADLLNPPIDQTYGPLLNSSYQRLGGNHEIWKYIREIWGGTSKEPKFPHLKIRRGVSIPLI